MRSMILSLLVVTLFAAGIRAEDKEKTREAKLGELTLKVPANWKQEKPANRLRLGQFKIPPAEGNEAPAELTVFSFGAQSAAANVKRWINQFQPQGRKVKVTTGDSPHGRYVLVDISGTYNKPIGPPIMGRTTPVPDSRALSVIIALEKKGSYFLKLVGPAKTVTVQADPFRQAFGGDAKKEKPFELDADR